MNLPNNLNKPNSDFQKDVINSGILVTGFNCIIQAPTGSGKTWLCEYAIRHTLESGKKAIYLSPLKSLAEELKVRWEKLFPNYKVGVFTGDYRQSNYPVTYTEAQLLILTPEKLDSCTRAWRHHYSWITELDLVVVDELHLLGDAHRGSRLEGMLLRIQRLNPFVRLLGLSATLGNRPELAHWLQGVEYSSSVRPIPLQWQIVKYKKASQKPALLHQVLLPNLEQGGQSLIFVQSRKRAEELATYLSSHTIAAAHHHGGLDLAARQEAERSFRSGEIRVLVATSTLEMGVNLPARQVILYDTSFHNGHEFLPLSCNSVWQRAGRAGRPGLDTVGEVVLLQASWERGSKDYTRGAFESIASQLTQPAALAEQIIAEVASGLCQSRTQLTSALSKSLAAHQGTLPKLEPLLGEMIQATMLIEEQNPQGQLKLRATRLGQISSRHMLLPATVLFFHQMLTTYPQMSFLDLLMVAACSEDLAPRLAVNYEDLDQLAHQLKHEASVLLGQNQKTLEEQTKVGGKRLLAAIYTAMTVRSWTRLGQASLVAQESHCYPYEVVRIAESMVRLLLAMGDLWGEQQRQTPKLPWEPPGPQLTEKIAALTKMVQMGLDEYAVTLTLVPGVGPILAQRLKEAGMAHIEDLALSTPATLAAIRGISIKRAKQWIEFATDHSHRYPGDYFVEDRDLQQVLPEDWPKDLEPYRLRRAYELRVVQGAGESQYQVSGGLEPHQVFLDKLWHCDCQDRRQGHVCKHILAVRLRLGEPKLVNFLRRLMHPSPNDYLDLVQLWMSAPTPTSTLTPISIARVMK